MFANFTQETCTGTGDTLTLAGAPAGAIPFSVSFSDGDLVSYALEDSGGSIKITGIGTYVSATNAITRNDTWNYNGTVVDKNPSTNITLSGGSHTIRCDTTRNNLESLSSNHRSTDVILNGAVGASAVNSSITMDTGAQIATPFLLKETSLISSIGYYVNVADAAAVGQIGLTKLIDGVCDTSYLSVDAADFTTTGEKAATVNLVLEAGWYMIHIVSNSALPSLRAVEFGAWGWSPLKRGTGTEYAPSHMLIRYFTTNGVLYADPELVNNGGNSTSQPGHYWMNRG